MRGIIDKAIVVKTVESSVDSFVNELLNSIKNDLDKILVKDSLDAEAIDDLRKIQYIIDEAKKAEAKVKNFDSKIDEVLQKTKEAIEAIKIFLEKYKDKELLSVRKVINDINEILQSCGKKLDFFSKKLQSLKTCFLSMSTLGSLEKDSSKQAFKRWAEFLELLSESLEECIEIIKDIPFEVIEKFSKDILLLVSEKSYNNHKKDQYKRRLKLAASYIIKIIEEKNFSSDRELRRPEYTIVRDLRTLAHAQYKITISQMMSQVNLKNIERLEEDDDDIGELAVDLDKIFHGTRNTDMS